MTLPQAYQPVELTSWASIQEAIGTASDHLDKVHGIVKNVKVCGWESPNCPHVPGSSTQPTKGTKYTRKAFQDAISLYEGVVVRLNHEQKTDKFGNRVGRDLLGNVGALRNFRIAEDGLRADFHYAQKNKFAPELEEEIEKDLRRWGFSHVVNGSGPVKDGWLIVESIPVVKGVDIVDRPATTASLLESQQMADKIPFSEICESLITRVKGKKRIALVSFIESDMMTKKCGANGLPLKEDDPGMSDALPPLGDTAVDAPADDVSPDDALWTGFRTAMLAIIDNADMDVGAKVAKLKEFLTAHDKLKGGEAPAAPAVAKESDPDGDDDADKKKDAEAKESLQRELNVYKNRDKIITLAESLGCKDRTALPDSLVKLLVQVSESDWRPAIQDHIKAARGPRSSGPLPGTPPSKDGSTTAPNLPMTREQTKALITSPT